MLNKSIIISLLLASHVFSMQEETPINPATDSRLLPERNAIIGENFALISVRPSMVDEIAPTVLDRDTMKLYGDGSIWPTARLAKCFYRRGIAMFDDQDLPFYFWAIVTKEGASGLVIVFKEDDHYEISYILDKKANGRGLTQKAVERVLRFLPDSPWEATAHPDNIASCKILTNVGFKKTKTEMHEKYGKLRNYYFRPSQECIENEEIIHFTYSGLDVPLKRLGL